MGIQRTSTLGDVMPKSKLLDRGEEILEVFPEVRYKSDRDGEMYAAGRESRKIRVTVSYTRVSSSDIPGQVTIDEVKITTRFFPGWDWNRCIFRGEEYNLDKPPHLSTGTSKATRHYELILRGRNGLDDKSEEMTNG